MRTNLKSLLPAIIVLFLIQGLAYSQERMDIPVHVNGKELVMPWNGGFNAPQFANIDLNRDGVTDMISFDRQGDVLRTYIHLPASGRWIMDLSYLKFFPALVDWVYIADYDQDGVEDILTSSSVTGVPGISIYKGSYSNDQWSFALQQDRGKAYLQVPAGNGLTNLYVSWDDIPAIVDIDGDGDLDVLAFEPGGSFISYYANQSIELGWGTDSIRFILKDICWGKILENELSETVYLSDNQNMCSDGNFTGDVYITPRHTGSTIMALDLDGDGDQDAFVGDISSRKLVFLHNGLTSQQAWITSQDSQFPSQDTTINLPFFVAAYSVQLDDDPEPELLAAVNSRALAEDRMSVWRFDDAVEGGTLDYKLEEKGFFQNQMIDIGSHSRPAVADVNGDGLPDMFIGGYHYSEGSVTRVPSLKLYQNIGSAEFPYFQKTNDDYLNMSQFGNLPTFDFAPAFGDIDGNGTIDLLVGDQNGKLFFYKNIAMPGEAMSFEPAVYNYMNINVGVSATPQIIDINGDGLGDLVIGERTGNSDNGGRCSNLNYFENVGIIGAAMFNSDVMMSPNTQCFGRVLFDIQIGLPQYSTPSIVRTPDGLVMMMGGDPGRLLLFDHLEQGKAGPISLVDDYWGFLDVGFRSAPVLADLNLDGTYEVIVGNQRGGLELFSTSLEVGYTSVVPVANAVYNPYILNTITNQGKIDVFWKNSIPGRVEVFNLHGAALRSDVSFADVLQVLDFNSLPSGIYFLRLTQQGNQWVEKVIKP